MLSKELLDELDLRIKLCRLSKEYHPHKVVIYEYCLSFDGLDELLAEVDEETFAEYLLRFMDERGANPVEVYKRAHLNRRFLSKLRTNRKYKPHKRTLIAIAFGLELSLDEAEDLLDSAGYSFSPYDETDVIAKFFFEQNIHDLFEVNEALDRYGCKILGG